MNSYEKTIIRLAILFGDLEQYEIKNKDIDGISKLLKIDTNLLKEALFSSNCNNHHLISVDFRNEIIKSGSYFDYNFFEIIVRYYFIITSLEQISEQVERSHIIKNIELFQDIYHNFEMINVRAATYECIHKDEFSFEYTIYNNSDFSPKSFISILELFVICEEHYTQNKNILPILYQILSYEFYTRTSTLYLISITQILKHSPFFDYNITKIAEDLYNHLLFMLHNARVISIQVNSLFQDLKKKPLERTRETDNTTRLQILYGYDNYDSYAIRLDLAHQGEGFVHYNNRTPGGIKSCIFSKSEYEKIIKDSPNLVKCFITYGKRWALKELSNCKMDSEERKLYFSIQKNKEHDTVFNAIYSEENVVSFISIIGKLKGFV